MSFKIVVFDFDGTIADTSEGILDAHRYALSSMGRDLPSDDELRKLIGGNLFKTYSETFGFGEEGARKAVDLYRKRYAEVGIFKAVLYPGFANMLKQFKSNGIKIGVATLKAERFANLMLERFGVSCLFDYVCGMDEGDKETKSSLITKCLSLSGFSKEECLFVGDSFNDYYGSKESCVPFLGVTYGFGFNKKTKHDFCTVDTARDIFAFVKNHLSDN